MNNKWFKTIAVSLICISISGTCLAPRAIGQTIGSKIPDLKIDGAFINGDQKSSLPDLYKKGGL